MTIKLSNSVASAAAIATLVISSLTPIALAADSTLIGGNGSRSSTSVEVSDNSSNTVVQDNNASIRNSVNSDSSTGGNVASGNTGGSVFIGSGASNQRVTIDNMANMNQAQISIPGSQGGSGNTSVLGNGSNSSNFVSNTSDKSNSIFQTNDAYFDNYVNLSAQTGGNYASDNTGRFGGNSPVSIISGNATSDVAIGNAANANSASIGGGTGVGLGNALSGTDISGNGSGSLNSASISQNDRNSVVQDNSASFNNNISEWLSSGENYSFGNTGGSTLIGSGSTNSSTWLDNRANLNRASLGGSNTNTGNQNTRISGNGSYSDNFYTQNSDNSNEVFQTGNASIDNLLSGYHSSGGNSASDNTGSIYGSGTTRLLSGSSTSDSYVSNQSNSNSYSSGWTMPGGWSLSLGWDMGNMLGM